MPGYSLRTINAWSDTTSTSITPAIGTENTDWFPGDLALIFGSARGTDTPTPPSGWTQLAQNSGGYIRLWGRVLQTGDTAQAFTWVGTSRKKMQCAIFSGSVYTDLATIVAHSSIRTDASTTQMPYEGLTVTTNNCLVLICSGKSKTATSDTTTILDEAGFTTIGKLANTGATSNIAAWAYVQQTTAANITAGSWDLTFSPGADEAGTVRGFTVALKTESTSPATRYNSFAEFMADGTIDMDNDTFKVCLVTSSYTPSASHTQLSDVSTYRVSGTTDTALASVTWAQTGGVATFDAADTVISFSTTQSVKYAVIYSDTSTNDNLVCYVTLPDSVSIAAGDSLRLTWSADGIFTLN